MENQNNNTNKFGEALIQKFVSEEVMTKTEFHQQLDRVMGKYTEHIDKRIDILQIDMDKRFEQVDKRFEQVDKRFAQIDIRYNWIIGLILTVGAGLATLMINLAKIYH